MVFVARFEPISLICNLKANLETSVSESAENQKAVTISLILVEFLETFCIYACENLKENCFC